MAFNNAKNSFFFISFMNFNLVKLDMRSKIVKYCISN